MAAGLLATTGVDLAADAYFFSVPSPSLVANNMAARRAVRTDAIQPSPSPRMATMSPPETASRLSSGSGVVVGGGSPPGVIIDSVVSRSPLVAGVLPAGVESAKRGRDDGKSPDFEVNLGKVISVLREDYPRIFFDAPSFDIFTDEIELRDPVSFASFEPLIIVRSVLTLCCGLFVFRPPSQQAMAVRSRRALHTNTTGATLTGIFGFVCCAGVCVVVACCTSRRRNRP